jgi:Terminase small subunit
MPSSDSAHTTTTDTPAGLSHQQMAFCRAYAKSFNATAAYKEAGYRVTSEGSASTCGARLLGNVEIQSYLAQILDVNEVQITGAVAAIAFTPITEVIRWDGAQVMVKQSDAWSDRAKLAVKKIKCKQYYDQETGAVTSADIEVEMFDRLSALEKLMRRFGLAAAVDSSKVEESTNDDGNSINRAESPGAKYFRDLTGHALHPVAVDAAAVPNAVD